MFIKTCPVCKKEINLTGDIFVCPECGSEILEIKYKDKQEKDNFEYPKTYKCVCGKQMKRIEGDNFYKYSYKCKCGKHIYGRQRNSLDIKEAQEIEKLYSK